MNTRSPRVPLALQTVLLALLLPLLAGCHKDSAKESAKPVAKAKSSVPVDAGLQQRLKEFVAAPRVSGRFSLSVYDLTAGKPVYAYNEHEPQPSASCMKLLSGLAGYHLLGTHYNYVTSLYTKGSVANGTLHGQIILKGSADPQFSADDLQALVRKLRASGVTALDGNVVLDLLLNDPVQAEQHWYPWDLERSKYGLLYQGSSRIGRTLVATLRAQGIKVDGNAVGVGRLPKGSRRVAHSLRTLDRVVERMWKNSSNTRATAMLYTIGQHTAGNDSAQTRGVAYLKHFLTETIGEHNPKLVVHDGCGLCRYNRLSAHALVDILRYGYQDRALYNKLQRYLSVAGVDGTARSLLSSADVRGRIHCKTGTLSHPYGISTLAGYCEAPNGHLLAFAVLSSEMSVLDAHVLQRRMCKIMVKEN